MTPDERNAIRARDAGPLVPSSGYWALWNRRALLTEVDRLEDEVRRTTTLLGEQNDLVGQLIRERDTSLMRAITADTDNAVSDERNRIRSLVLEEATLQLSTGVYVDLAAVLDDIEGEVSPPEQDQAILDTVNADPSVMERPL